MLNQNPDPRVDAFPTDTLISAIKVHVGNGELEKHPAYKKLQTRIDAMEVNHQYSEACCLLARTGRCLYKYQRDTLAAAHVFYSHGRILLYYRGFLRAAMQVLVLARGIFESQSTTAVYATATRFLLAECFRQQGHLENARHICPIHTIRKYTDGYAASIELECHVRQYPNLAAQYTEWVNDFGTQVAHRTVLFETCVRLAWTLGDSHLVRVNEVESCLRNMWNNEQILPPHARLMATLGRSCMEQENHTAAMHWLLKALCIQCTIGNNGVTTRDLAQTLLHVSRVWFFAGNTRAAIYAAEATLYDLREDGICDLLEDAHNQLCIYRDAQVHQHRQCIMCGSETLTKCSRCRSIYYCSTQCQKSDLERHSCGCHSPAQWKEWIPNYLLAGK